MEKAILSALEVYRVLSPGGLLLVSLASVRSSLFGEGLSAGRNTYVLEDGPEKGEIQHYFDEEEISMLLPPSQFHFIDARHKLEEELTVSTGLVPEVMKGRWGLTAEICKDE